MKKVVLALAVVFGVAMVSCSDKKAETAADTTLDTAVADTAVVVEEVANDTDTAVVAAEVTEAPAAEEAAK